MCFCYTKKRPSIKYVSTYKTVDMQVNGYESLLFQISEHIIQGALQQQYLEFLQIVVSRCLANHNGHIHWDRT